MIKKKIKIKIKVMIIIFVFLFKGDLLLQRLNFFNAATH